MKKEKSDQPEKTDAKKAPKAGKGKGKKKGVAEQPEVAEEPIGVRKKELGRRGEDAAAEYLQRRGYDIIARNWTCPFGEADIIARDMDAIIFVEVKTRTSIDKGYPEEAVTDEKRRRYELISLAFLSEYDEADLQIRFDVIGIVVMGDRACIRHHINAFGVA